MQTRGVGMARAAAASSGSLQRQTPQRATAGREQRRQRGRLPGGSRLQRRATAAGERDAGRWRGRARRTMAL